MYILGISAYYHDSAAALIKDGEIIAAAQEERFSRKKGDASLPKQAISYVLSEANLDIESVDHIVYYENSRKKFSRLVWNAIAFAPHTRESFVKSMSTFFGGKLFIERRIKEELGTSKKIEFVDHHLSHAASAFYPSPFREAAVLTLDGVGEWSTLTIGSGANNRLDLIMELRYPHSLGMLYSAFTYYCGFKVNSGEYKLMGLAPYGEPKYLREIYDNLLDVKEDGSFRLNMSFFDYYRGHRMTSEEFDHLFGGPARKPESPITTKQMDIAASIQVVVEDIILKLAKTARDVTQHENLCLAGGVALNCVANGKLIKSGIFKNIWIQPAAGDSGASLGAALQFYYQNNHSRLVQANRDSQKGSYLGPLYSNEEIKDYLESLGANFQRIENDLDLASKIADYISQGNVVGLFRGRMEFGPRALGNRSIIGDPRDPHMQKKMNLKIKYRESFRPFAPAVLAERVHDYFDLDAGTVSPYMLLVSDVHDKEKIQPTKESENFIGLEKLSVERSTIPAVTHVNYSARVQTVDSETNPFFHSIISSFDSKTGCPVVINTSFNVRGEPIVCDYKEAYQCFSRTEMDVLVLENYILKKDQQSFIEVSKNWQNEFPLD